MIKEIILSDGDVKHFSDKGLKIRQKETGVIYDSAIDRSPCRYTYEETSVPIEGELSSYELEAIITGNEI